MIAYGCAAVGADLGRGPRRALCPMAQRQDCVAAPAMTSLQRDTSFTRKPR